MRPWRRFGTRPRRQGRGAAGVSEENSQSSLIWNESSPKPPSSSPFAVSGASVGRGGYPGQASTTPGGGSAAADPSKTTIRLAVKPNGLMIKVRRG
jgi:hypothetical protein